MTIEKTEKQNWLNLAGFLWIGIGYLSILPAGFLFLFFDKPSPNWNANNFYIFSLISFPIVFIGTGIGILRVKNKYKKWLVMLPVLPIIFFFTAQVWMNIPDCGKFDCSVPVLLLKEQEPIINVYKCDLPIVDGGDGLETTGCGLLVPGLGGVATGIINRTSAHNWQFTTQNGDDVITFVEDDGKPCLEINILDSTGNIIKPLFYEPNKEGSAFFFPPTKDKNIYIMRLFTRESQCVYWLQLN